MIHRDQHTSALVARRTVRHRKVQLRVLAGPNQGLSVNGAGTTLRVGTAATNDLVLTDETVSRNHCEFELGTAGVTITDCGSTNGVLVRGLRVERATLLAPFEAQLGSTTVAAVPLLGSMERDLATNSRFGDLLGSSPRMLELFADLERIAHSDVSLLIEGETGTGKELVAESVHRESGRSQGPFVVFDCSSAAPSLVESELFGHERGAFTGAHQSRAGVFEQADGGTIFLDELGELPFELQPKLLRVLEKREVRRIGGSKAIPVSVRLVSATNRNLSHEVESGHFRQDLFFRVAGAHVRVPPLRDRMEELPALIDHFLVQLSPGRTHRDIPSDLYSMLKTHRWPGNVRELRNAVQRFLVMPEKPLGDTTIPPASSRRPSAAVTPLRIARQDSSEAFERAYVLELLACTGGNVTRAAALAEVSRQMIQKLMKRHGLA